MKKFVKMHGIGNDFVIFDHRSGGDAFSAAQVQAICHRRKGAGCDQLIVMEPSENADFFMRVYNQDGSESGACGNATRCVADIYMNEKGADSCVVETLSGLLPARRAADNQIEVDMGAPKLDWADIPLAEPADTLNLGIGEGAAHNPVAVNMGNPHCVFFVDDLEKVNIEQLGPLFETWPLFPERTNVEFVHVLSRKQVRLRTWERGAGLTLACGSAACATVVAGSLRNLTDRKIEIILDGGRLNLEWRTGDNHVLMTGPFTHVFDGTLKDL